MSHRTKYWMLCALAFGVATLAGVVIGVIVPAARASDNPVWVFPLLIGICGLVMAAGWLWWRKTDDLQQHGQLVSWYWGGTFGALVMLVYLAVFFGRHSDISLGAIYLFFAQFAGFFVFWLVWRLRGRGQAE
ncbi:cytochrome d ubiquinol oxidase subunit II [Porphyrobacter sp. YT40]|uniref:cytochrome d ubiquinol oxidase subunit II n=1 Tax=Porphyrobacter sp. YT40 TaxID=2547601 RepID=UPI0011431254|nr:cytochrome d ubiquinol oxidase subunit II [Porphyrobacter sp. YT40]QDH35958.1 cytochrome d ubiquinol oxidase subunit II [Porphyrobacter sp. YT40]